MIEEELDVFLKLIVVGNGGVGKSSMIQRYCKGFFTQNYKKTIGVDFLEKTLDYNDQEVKLQIWDTAGQEEFDCMTRGYYRGAHICLIVFSSTDRESFEALVSWKQKVQEECGEVLTAVIQNKMDLYNEFTVERHGLYEIEQLCQSLDYKLFRTSVKNNSNIDQVFSYLVDEHLTSQNRIQAEQKDLYTFRSLASIVLPAESKYHYAECNDRVETRLRAIRMDNKKRRVKKVISHSLSRC